MREGEGTDGVEGGGGDEVLWGVGVGVGEVGGIGVGAVDVDGEGTFFRPLDVGFGFFEGRAFSKIEMGPQVRALNPKVNERTNKRRGRTENAPE